MTSEYSALGVMAGSSMDGLDIVHVNFSLSGSSWSYQIKEGKTIPYSSEIYQMLKESSEMTEEKQELLDIKFGIWIGDCVCKFIIGVNKKIDFLSVHGHTVIHQPQNGISWQLGSGQEISKKTGIPTITDFRSEDISLGGQGAPLVPVGDFYLFKEFDACLNLGGIANISVKKDKTAWDITPCNQILNYYAAQLGHLYDENGKLSRGGDLEIGFIRQIQTNDYFGMKPPKSLPNQFLNNELLDKVNPQNGLKSMTEFIAMQISNDISKVEGSNLEMLVTGGGAHNDYLIERIAHHLPNWEITVPKPKLIDFKEAIVFAFLGALRMAGEINVLATVTGATKDSSSGVIHFAK